MPGQGTSNEYPQHIYSWRNKKNVNNFELKKRLFIYPNYGTDSPEQTVDRDQMPKNDQGLHHWPLSQ